jgi:hypothetical protein
MGTRSLTTFISTWKDDKGKVKNDKIVTMYRQFDGYPEGHGVELAEFIAQGKLVNGISSVEKQLVFNGMGCLAAQVVANFKDGPGNIYLHRGGTTNCWEEFRYEIIGNEETKELTFKCISVYEKAKVLYSGSAQGFLQFVEELKEKESSK